MTTTSVYARARGACEGVLLGKPVGAHVDMIDFLRAAPGIRWQALQEALQRMAAEEVIYVVTREAGWNRRPRIDHVLVRTAIGHSGGTHG